MGDVERAVAAATAVARRLGVACEDPVLLRDGGANLVVHLRPSPVVARIAWLTAQVRGEPARTLALEAELAAWCHGRGAPVRPPAPGTGGVHVQDGLVMTFWTHLPAVAPVEGDATVLGEGLARLHDVLEAFPRTLPGPEWIAADAHRIALLVARLGLLDVAELTGVQEELLDVVDRLRHVTRSRLEGRREGRVQPLHGDPHGRNCTRGPDGVVWFDLEDAWFGPVEFDVVVAASTAGVDAEAVAAAYRSAGGAALDPEVTATCAQLRELEVLTWSLLLGASRPERWDTAVERLRRHARTR